MGTKDTEIANEKDGSLTGLLFILSPIIAVYMAFKNYRTGWAKNIIWLFVVFYGATFVISNKKMDAASYSKTLLYNYSNQTEFGDLLQSFYNPATQQLDIVEPLLTHFVGTFTSNFHVLFAVYGLVFGFFYSRNIWYLLSRAEGKMNRQALVYIVVFVLIVGFWNINGFRFWTAAHVFFFGAFPLIFDQKKSYIWLAISSVLVHFTFIIPVIILLLYLLLALFFKNRVHLLFAFFIITFFVNTLNLDSIRSSMENILPEMLFSKTKGYTNEEYVMKVTDGKAEANVYARVFENALKWVVALFFIYIYAKHLKALRNYPKIFNLFSFSLLFLGVANLLSLIPSGGRFVILGNLFAIATVFFFLQNMKTINHSKMIFYVAMPFILLFVVVSLRLAADTISVTTITGNPVFMFFVDNDLALIEYLKP